VFLPFIDAELVLQNKLVKVVSVTFINSCQKLLKRLQAFELMYVCDG